MKIIVASLGTNHVLVTGVLVSSAGGSKLGWILSSCLATPGRSGQHQVSKANGGEILWTDRKEREWGGSNKICFSRES